MTNDERAELELALGGMESMTREARKARRELEAARDLASLLLSLLLFNAGRDESRRELDREGS